MNLTPKASMHSGKNNIRPSNRLAMDFSADQETSAPLIEIDSFLPLVKELSSAIRILPENTYVR